MLLGANDLARAVLKAETGTEAGRYNLLGLVGIFLLGVGAGLLDAVQALVRTGMSDYETGLPGLYSFVRLFAVTLILCVGMLVVAGALGERRAE